jgi:hypothetical protein
LLRVYPLLSNGRKQACMSQYLLTEMTTVFHTAKNLTYASTTFTIVTCVPLNVMIHMNNLATHYLLHKEVMLCLLLPWYQVILEKVNTQLVKIFPAFMQCEGSS